MCFHSVSYYSIWLTDGYIAPKTPFGLNLNSPLGYSLGNNDLGIVYCSLFLHFEERRDEFEAAVALS